MEINDSVILSETYNPIGYYHCKIDLEICKQDDGAIDIFFVPTNDCSDDEKKLLDMAKIQGSLAQKLLYDTFSYSTTMYHEGARFGINYAFDIFRKNTNFFGGFKINVLKISHGTTTTHDLVAFICAKMIWKALNFSPTKDIIHYLEKERVFFPEATVLYPIGKVTINELEKYVDSIMMLLKKNGIQEEEDSREVIFKYHENRILNHVQEYFALL